jgi:hypothetical protein
MYDPLITSVAKQHRRDIMTQAATADPADPGRSSRPRWLAGLLRTLRRSARRPPLPSQSRPRS